MNLSGNANRVLAILYDETQARQTPFVSRPALILLAAEIPQGELESALAELNQFAYISHSSCSVQLTHLGLQYVAEFPGGSRAMRDGDRSTTISNLTIGEIRMDNSNQYSGDHYDIRDSQVGAIGSNARAERFKQQADRRQISVDLSALAVELDLLRQKLAQEATSAADSQAVAEIHAAVEAAGAGDEPLIRRHLARAGRWALEVAERIGTELAAAALRRALGLGA
jgi:hypothetical protein